MNIYLHAEVAARELDSKLLLATLAASRGHDVLVSEIHTFGYLQNKRLLQPGIFHTTSLAPSESRFNRHRALKQQAFIVTSIDEEAQLVDWDYESFARGRFSDDAIAEASAVFCWGPHDYEELCRFYPRFKDRYHCSGSPRADLWRRQFSSFHSSRAEVPDSPYVLFSSNLGLINGYRRFADIVRGERNGGYFERDPESERAKYHRASEQILFIYEIVKALEHVADQIPEIQVILRPHPVEDPASWQDLLTPRPNLRVVRQGGITAWVNRSIAVIHNGCTTALEATVSGTPVITFIPFNQKYGRDLANQLGTRVDSKEAMVAAIRELLSNARPSTDEILPPPNDIVEYKIRYREYELAAERMINLWEEMGAELPVIANDWRKIQRTIAQRALKARLKRVRRSLGMLGPRTKGASLHKFPSLQEPEILDKIENLKRCLGITDPLLVRLVGDRAVLVKRKSRQSSGA